MSIAEQHARSAAPHEHTISARDGWRLSVLDIEPASSPVALVIAGHAMLADRRTLWRRNRPSLAGTLAAAGLRVLVPDLRGRGASGPTPAEGADWRYADLIDDVAAYLDLAKRLAPHLPVFIVGHSLFGHVALAYLGQHPVTSVAGLVLAGVNIWNRRFESSSWRWLAMRSFFAAVSVMVRMRGYMGARRVGAGTADEAGGYFRDMAFWVRNNRWGSPAGADYHAALANIHIPVLHVLSDGDPWYGRPDMALRFSAPLPQRDVLRAGPSAASADLRGISPTHMGLVTDHASEPLWNAMAAWIRTHLAA